MGLDVTLQLPPAHSSRGGREVLREAAAQGLAGRWLQAGPLPAGQPGGQPTRQGETCPWSCPGHHRSTVTFALPLQWCFTTPRERL